MPLILHKLAPPRNPKALQTISQSMAHDRSTQQAELGPSRRKRFHGKGEALVRGAVWQEQVSGKTFPDLRDFSGNIVILGARIAAHPVRE
jgi:hypothetical protein